MSHLPNGDSTASMHIDEQHKQAARGTATRTCRYCTSRPATAPGAHPNAPTSNSASRRQPHAHSERQRVHGNSQPEAQGDSRRRRWGGDTASAQKSARMRTRGAHTDMRPVHARQPRARARVQMQGDPTTMWRVQLHIARSSTAARAARSRSPTRAAASKRGGAAHAPRAPAAAAGRAGARCPNDVSRRGRGACASPPIGICIPPSSPTAPRSARARAARVRGSSGRARTSAPAASSYLRGDQISDIRYQISPAQTAPTTPSTQNALSQTPVGARAVHPPPPPTAARALARGVRDERGEARAGRRVAGDARRERAPQPREHGQPAPQRVRGRTMSVVPARIRIHNCPMGCPYGTSICAPRSSP